MYVQPSISGSQTCGCVSVLPRLSKSLKLALGCCCILLSKTTSKHWTRLNPNCSSKPGRWSVFSFPRASQRMHYHRKQNETQGNYEVVGEPVRRTTGKEHYLAWAVCVHTTQSDIHLTCYTSDALSFGLLRHPNSYLRFQTGVVGYSTSSQSLRASLSERTRHRTPAFRPHPDNPSNLLKHRHVWHIVLDLKKTILQIGGYKTPCTYPA